ncbi:hypothetical protein N8J89_15650 [Crossiella sp. CA-258035]|uniref:hypothetical protein n=1 Tax=Crossiella sp. CA-258035 TaxID=2981138 RepID=UPI0024BC72D1|nr:hypothetical protein [Crossiella sp. CA-258035]WHT22441.1 hypothetical protein N8J89_15650 [Crossiella sp. CA-258035]
MRVTALCLALLTTSALLTPAPARAAPAPCAWTATALEVPPGYQDASAEATNRQDLIVGRLTPASGFGDHLVLWRDGKATVLGRPFGLTGHPTAVSSTGVVTGLLDRASGEQVRHGFRYANGEFQRLETPPGADYARPHSVNAAGDVVAAVKGQLVRWPAGGAAHEVLAPPVPGEVADPYLDDEGRIAFTLYTGGRATIQLRHPDGRFQELLPPEPTGSMLAVQLHAGRVVGHLGLSNTVVWGVDGAVQQRISEEPRAINGTGRVLTAGNGAGQARLWQDGALVSELPWQYRADTQNALLEDGSVVGAMRVSSSRYHPAHLRCQ